MELTTTQLSLVAGVIISLLFGFLPALQPWFDSLEPLYLVIGSQRIALSRKRTLMAGVLLAAALVIFWSNCSSPLDIMACTSMYGRKLLEIYILAIMSNQATFKLTKG